MTERKLPGPNEKTDALTKLSTMTAPFTLYKSMPAIMVLMATGVGLVMQLRLIAEVSFSSSDPSERPSVTTASFKQTKEKDPYLVVTQPASPVSDCTKCDEGHQCDASYIEQVTEKCWLQGSLPECQLNCLDRTLASQTTTAMTTSHNNNNHNIWPPLGHGYWMEDMDVCNKTLCYLDRYRFSAVEEPFDSKSACQLLLDQHLTHVRMIGDSLGRHMYQGLVMLLAGSWEFGFVRAENCGGVEAFGGPPCRLTYGKSLQVCDGKVTAVFTQHNPRKDEQVSLATPVENQPTLVLYAVGNHPPMPADYNSFRAGILNVTAYSSHRWHYYENRASDSSNTFLFVWIPPHFKLSVGRVDETNQRALKFLYESSDFFNAWTLNTYTLTQTAAQYLCRECDTNMKNGLESCRYYERGSCEPTKETWDGYHYGRAINVWKAQLLMEFLKERFAQKTQ